MKTTSIFCTFFFSVNCLFAQQARFVASGRIEYEKSINAYAVIRTGQILGKNTAGNERDLLENYRLGRPQFLVLKSSLVFGGNKTLFTPTGTEPASPGPFSIPAAEQNSIVYADYAASTISAQKTVSGETFLVKDSTRRIDWKITSETRIIAGYTCRRANAVILDSVYVVAFYAESIHVPGGPELFSGLPGMILQLALPHEHITWRATKVEDTPVSAVSLQPPSKGKPVSSRQLHELLAESLKSRLPKDARLIQNLHSF